MKMNKTECQIIEDCPDFMQGCCQKYLDGDCSAHKCDLKIIRELESKVLALDARVADNHLQHRIEMCDLLREKLKAKEQECDKLKFNLKGAGILGLMKRNVQLKKALDDIEINISEYQGLILGKPRTMRENDCIYNILNIIDKVKELK